MVSVKEGVKGFQTEDPPLSSVKKASFKETMTKNFSRKPQEMTDFFSVENFRKYLIFSVHYADLGQVALSKIKQGEEPCANLLILSVQFILLGGPSLFITCRKYML